MSDGVVIGLVGAAIVGLMVFQGWFWRRERRKVEHAYGRPSAAVRIGALLFLVVLLVFKVLAAVRS